MSVWPPNYGTQIGPSAPIPALNTNTILVVNSNVAQSLTDAMSYCSLRGIPTANIRSFTFGTVEGITQLSGLQNTANPGFPGTTQYFKSTAAYNGIAAGASLLTVLNNEISNYGTLCVLFSTYTPTRVLATLSGAPAGYFTLQAIAAAAPVTLPLSALTTAGLEGFGVSVGATLAALESHVIASSWSSSTQLRPHGRLGCPDLTSATFAELPLAAGGTTVFANAVANAIAAESTNNALQPIHYSSVDTYVSGAAAAYAQYIASQGFVNTTDMLDQNALGGTLGSEFILINPMSPQQTLWCALLMGDFNGGLFPFSWFGAGLSAGVSSGSLSTAFVDPESGATNPRKIVLSNDQIIEANFTAGSTAVTGFSSPTSSNVSPAFSLAGDYGGYLYNSPTILAFENNYAIKSGGFGGGWWSYSYNLGMNLLYNGASAAVMTVGEPYANVAFGSEIFHFLVNQRVPICLANFFSPTVGGTAVIGTSVFGDPLYAPYANSFPPNYAAGRGLIGGTKIGVS